jgi:hypothetical protein
MQMANGDPIRMGLQNLQTGRTFLSRTGPNNPGDALYVTNVNTGDVVIADAARGRSLWALARNGTAVRAEAWGVGNGVEATAQLNEAITASAPLLGVAADSDAGLGVLGTSRAGAPYQPGDVIYPAGVHGVSPANAGVFGESASDWGVVGRSAGAQGGGVRGTADALDGVGVRGESASGDAVLGVATGAGTGITGQASTGMGVRGFSVGGSGVYGQSASANGVEGYSAAGTGILGQSGPTGRGGVEGSAPSGFGVLGTSVTDAGVRGASSNGSGVVGSSATGAGVVGEAAAHYGVIGRCSAPGGIGVLGFSPDNIGVAGSVRVGRGVSGYATAGTGVYGYVPGGAGVAGLSETGTGVIGNSDSGTAVYAYSVSGTALSAEAVSPALAGRFIGDVVVTGGFTVMGLKSAAVSHPDGTQRRLYCLESPQSWFEDFGVATVADGIATVQLDPDFAAIVDTSEYHVFLTSNDPVYLYVSAKDASSFQIRVAPGVGGVTEETAGTVTGSCSYRVVARRADIPGRRLEEVALAPQRDTAPIRPSGSGAADLPPLPPVTPPAPARTAPAEAQPPPAPTVPTLPPAMHALNREGWFDGGNSSTPASE